MPISLPLWLPYVMHAAVLFCLLLVFIQLKAEISRLRRENANRGQDLAGRIVEQEAGLELLKSGLAKLEQNMETAAAQPMRRQALDPNRRAQVLRLHQQGERTENISRRLHIPRSEVDLLLKIHKYSLEN